MDLESQKKVDRVAGGALLILMKPFVVFLGRVLRRNHGLEVRGGISVIKMLGGGSLVIALPALLGLRNRYPRATMRLVTTPTIAPFARTLGIFDEIIAIDSSSLPRLAVTALIALRKCFRSDCFLDLEVYSRLTTVFSVFTCARNRLGFYLESVIWRKPIHTHLIFFNRHAPVHLFYERMALLLGASPASYQDCRERVLRTIEAHAMASGGGPRRVVIGVGCSKLSAERMFRPEQWAEVIRRRRTAMPAAAETVFEFLGSEEDAIPAARVAELVGGLPGENLCGRLSLEESLRRLSRADEFWGIDSALLHFARLFGLKTVSYWGPTSPDALLKPAPPGQIEEEIHYQRIPCSPCVHVAEFPPCSGRNICMSAHLEPIAEADITASLPVLIGSS